MSHENSPTEAVKRNIESFRVDYEREHNPVYVWRALFWCLSFDGHASMPPWIVKYLEQAAEAVVKLAQNVKAGGTSEREAETIGKALGFGAGGSGATSHFEAAFLLDRDRELHAQVQELIANGDKPYIAQENVGKTSGWGKAVVARACEHVAEVDGAANKSGKT